jgi:hypothetical protein
MGITTADPFAMQDSEGESNISPGWCKIKR